MILDCLQNKAEGKTIDLIVDYKNYRVIKIFSLNR